MREPALHLGDDRLYGIDPEVRDKLAGLGNTLVDDAPDVAAEFHRTWRAISGRSLHVHLEGKFLVVNSLRKVEPPAPRMRGGKYCFHLPTPDAPNGWTWKDLILMVYMKSGHRTQKGFCQRMGFDDKALWRWLHQGKNPSDQAAEKLLTLARKLGVIEEAA